MQSIDHQRKKEAITTKASDFWVRLVSEESQLGMWVGFLVLTPADHAVVPSVIPIQQRGRSFRGDLRVCQIIIASALRNVITDHDDGGSRFRKN
mmetsp:Transcript_27356/g.40060  ORF Transcript_27356/g.40060 Transcript_27356/m.40060 type:complete len:94 (+) Transcript_27356:737-1018(+)